jgi:hypothetical protein
MTVYIVVRQCRDNAFIWAAFDNVEKADSYIDEQEERGFQGFYIKELAVNEG